MATVHAEKTRPKVLRVYHAHATNWDFQNSVTSESRYWERVNIDACRKMIAEGLKTFTKNPTLDEAWNWILYQNGGKGYVKGQKISIKLNWNDCDPGLGDGPNGNYLVSNTQLVQAVVESLLVHVPGLRPENLLVGDPSRIPYDRIRSALAGLGVQVIEFKPDIFIASPDGRLNYPNWQDDYVCDAMFGQSTHLIEMPLLKAITPSWGVAGVLKDAQGKVGLAKASYHDNRKAWKKKHRETFSHTDRLNTLVHMNSHPWIKGKRRLIIADGLYGLFNGQHFPSGPKDDIPRPWMLFNNAFPNSILFSTDPVAIDCVMHDLVRFERMCQGLSGSFLKPVKFQKPIQLACAVAGLGTNDEPAESKVTPSPIGPVISYANIDYEVADVTFRKPGLEE
ncbi:MAG: hypothetical protein BROFUL_02376 [Candidatus Brocadia fulgida]|jgi:hypothetical protein|uniref:DUF362 domain-containing protein n=1 Tax=Candidatus Brocadia fulgida TaxID=380242 RepID=A0A0M2US71_9BACT|nr:MAG: hypothetical protein BROFUL_02376 [Candidatus Brocadia fulgida]